MEVLERARRAAAEVVDPELPMLTLADLGVLRDVVVTDEGAVEVALTPTYTGCPALAEMRSDVVHRLKAVGFDDVRVRVELDPPWSTDLISDRGRVALADAGLSPPGPAPQRTGPIPLRLSGIRREVHCPRCGSGEVALVSEFGATACQAQYRCDACLEPFDHMKEL